MSKTKTGKRRKRIIKCHVCGAKMKRHYREGHLDHIQCGTCGWTIR
jgi:Zn ribbon nucleic-acid-binding protein